MILKRIDFLNRKEVNDFITKQWFTTTMVVRGKEIDMTKAEGFFFQEGYYIVGLITYAVYGDTLEILSLDSMRENQGIGEKLLDTAVKEAAGRK